MCGGDDAGEPVDTKLMKRLHPLFRKSHHLALNNFVFRKAVTGGITAKSELFSLSTSIVSPLMTLKLK